ncbi:15-cis-phytoene desaturase [Carex littledalei]|uniref:15-cis-phytoene desaturase n=1 Tax=Carex littledalei TaxID=544730 RepID=A0A833RFC6_9POAL|nr:15-cis-phytoene desaturase [Carex littledalei]
MWASTSTSGCARATCFPATPSAIRPRRRPLFRAELSSSHKATQPKKVVVVGAGWAGLASAHHLINQGFDVTLLQAGSGPTEEVSLRGFWYPYRNIFSLVDGLGIKPFTKWIKASYFSPEGLEVNFPVFRDQPKLPAPLGALAYPQFPRLPLVDRLTSFPLIAAVIDFDNTDTAWRKYDTITARELFKQYGCSQRLYREVFEPAVQAGLFAPGEQSSAAVTLGMLYYYILSHQQNFDFVLCRGEVGVKIFTPWIDFLTSNGLKVCKNSVTTDLILSEDTGCISQVVCEGDVYEADAFVLALGISSLQSIILSSRVLQSHQEFLNVLKLSTSDVVYVKLWFDKKVKIPTAANVCCGIDESIAWTFYDLSSVYDEYKDQPNTILEVEFSCASDLLPLKDEQIVESAIAKLTKCMQEFEDAEVVQQKVVRCPKSATQFSPGTYKYMMRGATSFPNLFMAGDWIVNRHGSWSKEKAYVTGLEAANRVVDYLGEGEFAKIISVEEDEAHIEALRSLNRRANELFTQLPISEFFL